MIPEKDAILEEDGKVNNFKQKKKRDITRITALELDVCHGEI